MKKHKFEIRLTHHKKKKINSHIYKFITKADKVDTVVIIEVDDYVKSNYKCKDLVHFYK